jgi:hypothetical protein
MNTIIRPILSAVAVLSLSVLTSGCVALGGIDRNTGVIDTSVGISRNNSVLQNIIRASQHEPLYFYSVSKVSGGGTEDFKLSLPPFTLGPRQTIAQRNYTFGTNGLDVLDTSQNGNFDVAPLQSKDFYSGMLAPLDLVEINILLKQGYPRELVYRLIVEDVTIYGSTGLHRYRNDPQSKDYAAFNLLLGEAIKHGVTTETFLVPNSGAGAAASDASKKGGNPGEVPYARLCFDPALYAPGSQEAADVASSGNVCGERPPISIPQVSGAMAESLEQTYKDCIAPPTSPTGSTEQNKNRVCAHVGKEIFAVQLDTRSVFGIFDYLGTALSKGSNVELAGAGAEIEPRTTGPLITITKGWSDSCFAIANQHGRYCVPNQGSDNLKMTFSIINMLQALKTSPGDLPVTTAVRIEQ